MQQVGGSMASFTAMANARASMAQLLAETTPPTGQLKPLEFHKAFCNTEKIQQPNGSKTNKWWVTPTSCGADGPFEAGV
jgi:hypothetical protein